MSDDGFDSEIGSSGRPPADTGGVKVPPVSASPIPRRTARPETESFRRSEAYLAGQIARAVARGQRTQ